MPQRLHERDDRHPELGRDVEYRRHVAGRERVRRDRLFDALVGEFVLVLNEDDVLLE